MILESWAGALGQPRGMIWGGRREEGSGWGTHVYLWQIHFDIWQNQYNIAKLKKKSAVYINIASQRIHVRAFSAHKPNLVSGVEVHRFCSKVNLLRPHN